MYVFLNIMHLVLQICEQFVIDLDVKFNSFKPTVIRIGERFNASCAPLSLHGCELQYVQCPYLALYKPFTYLLTYLNTWVFIFYLVNISNVVSRMYK